MLGLGVRGATPEGYPKAGFSRQLPRPDPTWRGLVHNGYAPDPDYVPAVPEVKQPDIDDPPGSLRDGGWFIVKPPEEPPEPPVLDETNNEYAGGEGHDLRDYSKEQDVEAVVGRDPEKEALRPLLQAVYPRQGPVSGGQKLVMVGPALGFGRVEDDVESVTIAGVPCVDVAAATASDLADAVRRQRLLQLGPMDGLVPHSLTSSSMLCCSKALTEEEASQLATKAARSRMPNPLEGAADGSTHVCAVRARTDACPDGFRKVRDMASFLDGGDPGGVACCGFYDQSPDRRDGPCAAPACVDTARERDLFGGLRRDASDRYALLIRAEAAAGAVGELVGGVVGALAGSGAGEVAEAGARQLGAALPGLLGGSLLETGEGAAHRAALRVAGNPDEVERELRRWAQQPTTSDPATVLSRPHLIQHLRCRTGPSFLAGGAVNGRVMVVSRALGVIEAGERARYQYLEPPMIESLQKSMAEDILKAREEYERLHQQSAAANASLAGAVAEAGAEALAGAGVEALAGAAGGLASLVKR